MRPHLVHREESVQQKPRSTGEPVSSPRVGETWTSLSFLLCVELVSAEDELLGCAPLLWRGWALFILLFTNSWARSCSLT